MKMLCVRQPWAHLLAKGIKDVENRDWERTYRGPLLIHASKARTPDVLAHIEQQVAKGNIARDEVLHFGGIVGLVELVDIIDDSESEWAGDGSLHWCVTNARPVPFVKKKGMVGLLNVEWPQPASPPDVAKECAVRAGDLVSTAGWHTIEEDDDFACDGVDEDEEADDDDGAEQAMAAFRRGARKRGSMEPDEAIRQAAYALGYERVSARIAEALQEHVSTAIERRVLARDGGLVRSDTTRMADYSTEEIHAAMAEVMCAGEATDRDQVFRAVAAHLGFSRLTEGVIKPIKSAVNAAIRRGVLVRDGAAVLLPTTSDVAEVADDEPSFDTDEDAGTLDEDAGGPEEEASYGRHEVIRVADADPTERCDVQLEVFQTDAVASLDADLRNGRRAGMVVLPTGGGKTRTALEWLFKRFISEGKRVLWVTHRLDLLDQVHEEIRGLAFLARGRDEISVSRYDGVAGGRSDTSGDFVLASAASLARREPTARAFSSGGRELGVIVYDEAHGSVAKKRRRALEGLLRSSDARLLGLTATPFRSSEKGTARLREIFEGDPIYEIGFSDLIRVGFLARPQILHQRLQTTEELELSSTEVTEMREKQEVSWSVLSRLSKDDDRSREIVDHWCRESHRYAKTVVFACNISHAQRLEQFFKKAGVEARAVHHHLERDVRRRTLSWFKEASGSAVIINVGLLTEGWNVPDTRTVLMARPTLSTGLYLQMIGRGSRGPRVVPGKTSFYVIDCVDNFARHGLQLAGARVAGLLNDEPTGDAEERSIRATKPATDEQIETLTTGAKVLALRGLELHHYRIWGELRWTSPAKKRRSVAVFSETRPAVEEALARLDAALAGQVDWDEVADLGIELDGQGAIRCLDWDDLVDSAEATRTMPDLVAVELDEAAFNRPALAAELVAAVLMDASGLEPTSVAKRCTELSHERRADIEAAFGGEGQFILAVLEAQAREAQGKARAPRRIALADAPIGDAAMLCLYVMACDHVVQDAEEAAIARALHRMFRPSEDPATLVARCAEGWRQREAFNAPAAAAALSRRPYPERLLLLDGLFRLTIHDGRLELSERQRLAEVSEYLRLPPSALDDFLGWWRDVAVHHHFVPGYVNCGACGTNWEEASKYCGECGARLGEPKGETLRDEAAV